MAHPTRKKTEHALHMMTSNGGSESKRLSWKTRCMISPCGTDNGQAFEDDITSKHSGTSGEEETSISSVLSGSKSFTGHFCKLGSLSRNRWQMFQMIFLLMVPIIALLIQNSKLLTSVVSTLRESEQIRDQVCYLIQPLAIDGYILATFE